MFLWPNIHPRKRPATHLAASPAPCPPGTQEANPDGAYSCYKLFCDWQTQYCTDGGVMRDEHNQWACLGTCTKRSKATDQFDTCSCTQTGSEAPADFQNSYFCFYGNRAYLDMWTPPPELATKDGAWRSRQDFEATYGPVSLYLSDQDTSYERALTSFLTTDCALMDPIKISVPDTRYTPPLNVTMNFRLNSCGCRKSENSWMKLPDLR